MVIKELRAAWWVTVVGVGVVALSIFTLLTSNLHAITLQQLAAQTDATWEAVTNGHLSTTSAAIWAAFYAGNMLYLFVGVVSALFGARLLAGEESSGSIFFLLSRPLSRERIVLTKYGVCALALLVLCCICGGAALVIGAMVGVAQPVGGVIVSTLLLWLASLCVLGITLVYSVLIPSSLAAGFLGFFTIYVLSLAPLFHNQNPSLPGGQQW
ncbi:MAG TPA: ABC transporter permease subunit, partial [Ktedonobacteraceae bacterium]|nr:ABC transporter permease subunit [Ktedonobacteraceae bacterium]